MRLFISITALYCGIIGKSSLASDLQGRGDSNNEAQQRALQAEDGDNFICPICGDDASITLPTAELAVPALSGDLVTWTCEDLEASGILGNISSIECPLIQPLVQDVCGCEQGTSDSDPAPTPEGDGNQDDNTAAPLTPTEEPSVAGKAFHSSKFSVVGLSAMVAMCASWCLC